MSGPVIRWQSDIIDGVHYRRLEMHHDNRGSFMEVFSELWGLPVQPVQWSVVSSHPKALRGMHLHLRHDEYIMIIRGRACVGLYDLRRRSRTMGVASLIELDATESACLSFPSGILHGWYFYEESIHLQGVSELYKTYSIDDNLGCQWSDPVLNIPWPDTSPIISARSASFPSLNELIHTLSRNGVSL